MESLPSKAFIVLVGNAIFFGLCLCIWVVAKLFPRWEVKRREERSRPERASEEERAEGREG